MEEKKYRGQGLLAAQPAEPRFGKGFRWERNKKVVGRDWRNAAVEEKVGSEGCRNNRNRSDLKGYEAYDFQRQYYCPHMFDL